MKNAFSSLHLQMIQWQFPGNSGPLPRNGAVAVRGNPRADQIIGNMLLFFPQQARALKMSVVKQIQLQIECD